MAQCSQEHANLRALLAPSTLVVEAQVKNASSFWGNEGEMIYTRYELEVFQVFKGDLRNTIEVVAPGGVVGGQAIKVVPSTSLQVGEVGIFALKPAIYNLPRSSSLLMQSVAPGGPLVTYSPDYEEAYFYTGEVAARPAAYRKVSAETHMAPVRKKALPEIRFNQRFMPQIDSITPDLVAAGVGDIITIHGQGFGEGAGTVFFRDADRGGSGFVAALPWHITSWTTTAIAIKVPHKAGTGAPLILTGSGGIAFSPYDVNVSFAYNNVMSSGQFYQPKLIDHNSRDDGGYLFRLSDNSSYNGVPVAGAEGALEALNAAAGAWQDSIGIPVYIGHDCPAVSESINGSLDDGQNVISFDHDEWDIREQLGEQVLAATVSRYAKCGDSEWELTDVDIVIRRGALYNEGDEVHWSFDGTPSENELDFQSVMLHELGHALQLQHVVNPDGVMHYAATFGGTHHELGFDDDIAGGLYAMMESRAYDPPTMSCFPTDHFERSRRLGKYSPGHNCAPDNGEVGMEGLQSVAFASGLDGFKVDVFPNPKPKGAPLQLSVNTETPGTVLLSLFSSSGQRIAYREVLVVKGANTLDWLLPALPSGFYQLLVQHGADRAPRKIVIP